MLTRSELGSTLVDCSQQMAAEHQGNCAWPPAVEDQLQAENDGPWNIRIGVIQLERNHLQRRLQIYATFTKPNPEKPPICVRDVIAIVLENNIIQKCRDLLTFTPLYWIYLTDGPRLPLHEYLNKGEYWSTSRCTHIYRHNSYLVQHSLSFFMIFGHLYI